MFTLVWYQAFPPKKKTLLMTTYQELLSSSTTIWCEYIKSLFNKLITIYFLICYNFQRGIWVDPNINRLFWTLKLSLPLFNWAYGLQFPFLS